MHNDSPSSGADTQNKLVGWLIGFVIVVAVIVIPSLYLLGVAVYVGEGASMNGKNTKVCNYWWGFKLLQKPVQSDQVCSLIENGATLPLNR